MSMSAIIENTSNTEFDLQKRVQFTNEIPNYDMFKRLHSGLQDTLWKWFCGWQKIVRDLPAKVEGETGAESPETFYKMVNGVMAEKYGPSPYLVWDSENKKYKEVDPKFHRLEINGVLLPEFDLFMHEIYRYLGRMYPDHPDFAELLTNNELNDIIKNAADFIDYDIDLQLMELICSDSEDGLDFNKKEALKTKIRNLLNHNVRRKFYGSNTGFKALASGIGYWGEMYPVLTYYPLKKAQYKFVEDPNGNCTDGTKNYRIEYDENDLGKIDVSQNLLGNKVRIIDFDRQMTLPEKSSDVVNNFKFITYQGYESFGFETDIDTAALTLPNFENSQLTEDLKENPSKTYSTDYSLNIKKTGTDYSADEKTFKQKESTSNNKAVKLSQLLPVRYLTLYSYPKIDDIVAEVKEFTDKELTVFKNNYVAVDPLFKKASTYYFKNLVRAFTSVKSLDIKEAQVLPDLFHDGYLDVPLKVIENIYPKTSTITKRYSEGILADFVVTADKVTSYPYEIGSLLGSMNYAVNKGEENALYKVLGYNKGFFEVDFGSYVPSSRFKTGEVYGLLFKTDLGHTFLQGSLTVKDELSVKKAEFQLTCIPEKIPAEVCKMAGLKSDTNYPLYLDTVINDIETEVATIKIDSTASIYNLGFKNDDVDWTEDAIIKNCSLTKVDYGAVCVFPIYENNKFNNVSWDDYVDNLLSVSTETFEGKDTETNEDFSFDLVIFDRNKSLEELEKSVSFSLSTYNNYLVSAAAKLATTVYWKDKAVYDEIFNATISKDESNGKAILTFSQDDENRVKNLSLGCKVLSSYLPSETFIENITENAEVILSEAPLDTGTFQIRILNKNRLTLDDKTKDFNLDQRLVNLDLKESDSVFDHGLYGSKDYPRVSGIRPKAVLDVNLYKPYVRTFNEVVSYLYRDKSEMVEGLTASNGSGVYNSLTQPSAMVNQRDVFLEIVADKLIKKATSAGSTPNLMVKEILDYLTESVNETVLACETPNVGVQLSMETDTSGYFTYDEAAFYTDPSTHVKFQTFDWEVGTIPAYVKLGNSGDTNQGLFIKPGQKLAEDVYGTAIYNKGVNDEKLKSFEKEGGKLNNLSMYGFKPLDAETIKKDTGNTLMKLDLGEHNIILNYIKGEDTLTIVQFSIVKKNVSKKLNIDPKDFKIADKSYLEPKYVLSNTNSSLQLNYLGLISSVDDVKIDGLDSNEFNYWLVKSAFNFNSDKTSLDLQMSEFLVYYQGTFLRIKNKLGSVLLSNLFTSTTITTNEISKTIVDFWNKDYTFESLEKAFQESALDMSTFYWVHNVQNLTKDKNNQYSGDTNVIWYNPKEKRVEILTVNDNFLTDSISFEKPTQMSATIFAYLSLDNYKTPVSRIKKQECSINIDSTLVKDSLNLEFKLKVPFLSEGYKAEKDEQGYITVDKSAKYYFNVAYSDFKYDSITDEFYVESPMYTKSGDSWIQSDKTYLFQVIFQTPTYFKHLNKICGVLTKETSVNTDLSSEDKYFLKGVEGINFDLSKVSSEDKVVAVKRVDLRSPYNADLESVGFNNYAHLQLPIRSINPTSKKIVLGPNYGRKFQTDKNKYLTDINKLFTKSNAETTENYESSLQAIQVGQPLQISGQDTAFKYFKNNLVFSARISKDDPACLIPSDSVVFNNALSKISTGDLLNNVLPQNSISNEFTTIPVKKSDGSSVEVRRLINTPSILFVISSANNLFYSVSKDTSKGYLEVKPLNLKVDYPDTVDIQATSNEVYVADGGKLVMYRFGSETLNLIDTYLLSDPVDFDTTFEADTPKIDVNTKVNSPIILKVYNETVFISKGNSISYKLNSNSKWWLSKYPENYDYTSIMLNVSGGGSAPEAGSMVASSYLTATIDRLTALKTNLATLRNSGLVVNTDATAIQAFIDLATSLKSKVDYKSFTAMIGSDGYATLPFSYSKDKTTGVVTISTSNKMKIPANAEKLGVDAVDAYMDYLTLVLKVCMEDCYVDFNTSKDLTIKTSDSVLRVKTTEGDLLTLNISGIDKKAADNPTTEDRTRWDRVSISFYENNKNYDFQVTAIDPSSDSFNVFKLDGKNLSFATFKDYKTYDIIGSISDPKTSILYGSHWSASKIEESLNRRGLRTIIPADDLETTRYNTTNYTVPFLAIRTDSSEGEAYKVVDLRTVLANVVANRNMRINNIDIENGYFKAYLSDVNGTVDISGYLRASTLEPTKWEWVSETQEYNRFFGCEPSISSFYYRKDAPQAILASVDVGLSNTETTLNVLSISDNYIKLTEPLVKSKLNDDVLVLVSFTTSKDVAVPELYLTQEDFSKFGSKPGFKGMFTLEVQNYVTADKFFNKREVENVLQSYIGYPAVSEDKNKEFYKYDENGQPITFVNSFGNTIYLCDSEGRLLSKSGNGSTVPIESLVNENLSTSDQGKEAAEPTYKNSAAIERASLIAMDDNLTNLFTNLNLKSNLLDRLKSVIELSYSGNVENFNKYIPSSDLEIVKQNIKDSYTDEIDTDNVRIEDGKIVDSEGNILVEDLFIDFYINCSSESNNEQVVIDHINLNTYENGSLYESLSAVYLNPQGYGGRLGKDETDQELPWETDAEAFDDTDLKNLLGEPVLLADKDGNVVDHISGYKELKRTSSEAQLIEGTKLKEGINEVKIQDETNTEIFNYKTYKSVLDFSLKTDLNVYPIITNDIGIISDQNENNSVIDFKLLLNNLELKSIDTIDYLKNCKYELKINGSVLNKDLYTITDSEGIRQIKFSTKESIIDSVKGSELTEVELSLIKGEETLASHKFNLMFIDKKSLELNDKTSSFADLVKYSWNENSNKLIIEFFNEYLDLTTDCEETHYINKDVTVYTISGTEFKLNFKQFNLSVDFIYNKPSKIYSSEVEIFNISDVGILNSKTTQLALGVIYNKAPLDFYTDIKVVTDRNPKGITLENGIALVHKDSTEATFNYNGIEYSTALELKTSEVTLKGPLSTDALLSDTISVNVAVNVAEGSIFKGKLFGFRGVVAIRRPKYATFRLLHTEKGDVIRTKTYNIETLENSSILSLDTSNAKIYFNAHSELKENCYYEVTLLPKKTVTLSIQDTQNADLIYKLSEKELEEFTPDRVYYPSKLMSPFVAGGKYFANSTELFSRDYYKNDNNEYVYICDENGKLLTATVNDSGYKLSVLDPNDISQKKLRSFKPKNLSLKAYFKDDFYLDTDRSNPFYTIFKGYFQNNTQDLSLATYTPYKNGTKMALKLDESSLILREGIADSNGITKSAFCDFTNGKINLILDYNCDEKEALKYGIVYFNPIKENSDEVEFDSSLSLNGDVDLTYSLYSFKNYNLPDSKENTGVIEINELGLFTKEGKMIAYATFPPIEYRSETQHVSFNCFIRRGNNK